MHLYTTITTTTTIPYLSIQHTATGPSTTHTRPQQSQEALVPSRAGVPGACRWSRSSTRWSRSSTRWSRSSTRWRQRRRERRQDQDTTTRPPMAWGAVSQVYGLGKRVMVMREGRK
ncbi:Hypothetical_protein [Hexamita inflata]|uniref:Hypothetical_protein n=1 Tax=Hexamita inflata TaxID=28002 RepID=A0AA86NQ04_9EUKA|nr:Hypothetical protein HINF_LOCUS12042 [Hexamita inflata]